MLIEDLTLESDLISLDPIEIMWVDGVSEYGQSMLP